MAREFRCPACGYADFLQHRLDLVQEALHVRLGREDGSLAPSAYLEQSSSPEIETLFVYGYECLGCEALYSTRGRRLEKLLQAPPVYVGDGPGGSE